LLQLLVAAVGARRVLEVGTLAGCGAIRLARALPADGRVVTLEREPAHAAFAGEWLARAGVADRVELRVGRALDLLPALDGERFDLVFLDADRAPLPRYLEWALRLLRPGGVVVADRSLAGGRVADPAATDAATEGVREFNRRLTSDPRLTGVVLPGEDGVAVGVVRSESGMGNGE
jgi:predicted O-methyltransferase YrrM